MGTITGIRCNRAKTGKLTVGWIFRVYCLRSSLKVYAYPKDLWQNRFRLDTIPIPLWWQPSGAPLIAYKFWV